MMRTTPKEVTVPLEKEIRPWTADGAWCFFADPRAVYYEGEHRRTYVGWLTRAGDVMAGFLDHDTGEMRTCTVRERLEADDHANPSLLFLENGHLVIFYSAHGGPEMYCRISERPESIDAWGEERTVGVNTEGRFGYTYPNPVRLAEEGHRVYLFWRGGNFKPNFAVSDDGCRSFGPVRTLLAGSGARPYIKFASDGRKRIWFAYTDGHPNVEPQNGIYCAYYEGGAVHRPDGARIKTAEELPFAPQEAHRIYDGSDGPAWIWDIALDAAERPVVVFSVCVELTDHRYRYAVWTGERWETHEITAAGKWFPQTPPGAVEREPYYSGGVVLDHADPSVVYLSRETGGVFEIEEWMTADRGRTWRSSPVTAGSAKNNVRPVAVRGLPPGRREVLWMNGDYIGYRDYRTRLLYYRNAGR